MKLEQITTVFPKGKKKAERKLISFTEDADALENEVVNIYPEVTRQSLEGFGGAFTEAAGYVFAAMPETLQERLLQAYFGADGAGYTLGRMHLDSCDFCLGHYEAMSDPADRALKSFSMARNEKYLLPLVYAAQRVLGRPVEMMAAPWSPPAFMKTTGERNFGGSLKEEYHGFWADYLCRYLTELKNAGCRIRRMTVQNEPNAVQTWDSCVYTTRQEKIFIRDYLAPALDKNGLSDIEIYLWDHNKERAFERARDIMDDAGAARMVSGLAFHFYSGDHFEALELIRDTYPGLKLALTEVGIELKQLSGNAILNGGQSIARDMIGSLNAGMTAFYDWNLLLDGGGGPHHAGLLGEAPFMYHMDTGILEERPSFSYITHFSRYLKPGAIRVALTRYTADIEMTAFQNPDRSLAVVWLNRTKKPLPMFLRMCGQMAEVTLPPLSISTGVINQ